MWPTGDDVTRLLGTPTDPKRRTPPYSRLRRLTFVKQAPFLTGSSVGPSQRLSTDAPQSRSPAPAKSNLSSNAGSNVLGRANAWSENAVPEGRQANGVSAFAEQTKKRWLPTLPLAPFRECGTKIRFGTAQQKKSLRLKA